MTPTPTLFISPTARQWRPHRIAAIVGSKIGSGPIWWSLIERPVLGVSREHAFEMFARALHRDYEREDIPCPIQIVSIREVGQTSETLH